MTLSWVVCPTIGPMDRGGTFDLISLLAELEGGVRGTDAVGCFAGVFVGERE